MGNRGGRLHRDDRTLGAARWKTKSWIACVCAFKGRRREVFGAGYSELFFLDEPTALAAGHRPCFECRRADARAFARAIDSLDPPTAGAMDSRLDAERRAGRLKRLHETRIDDLPDGGFYAEGEAAFAVRGAHILPWSFSGYGPPRRRPHGVIVAALTPPTTLRALSNGYAPLWHASAG